MKPRHPKILARFYPDSLLSLIWFCPIFFLQNKQSNLRPKLKQIKIIKYKHRSLHEYNKARRNTAVIQKYPSRLSKINFYPTNDLRADKLKQGMPQTTTISTRLTR